jgi:hypothetical protein
MRYLPVVHSGILKPAILIGGNVLQCRRVFIHHPARCGGKGLKKRKILDVLTLIVGCRLPRQ